MRRVQDRTHCLTLVAYSPLRGVDPRTKLLLSVCTSLAVMLPLERLLIALALYVGLLLWARLIETAAQQVWRLKWLLIIVFVVDWLVVGLELAIAVTTRIVLMAGILTLVVSTTTPDEFRLALEKMRVPYRYAFSLGLAFQSLDLLGDEWRAIQEAQRSRGAWSVGRGLSDLMRSVGSLIALTVPAIVLTTRRAWSMTEAACARGFDAPHRRPYRQLSMRWTDWALLLGAVGLIAALIIWP
ncbi:MAG: energy-coupling factor transporter transmembrane protein EcfT [Anaerolineae bacterium]|nr:energy-coupling factor transporter transmembrane protein EcfT [Anaerolineae bacterium]